MEKKVKKKSPLYHVIKGDFGQQWLIEPISGYWGNKFNGDLQGPDAKEWAEKICRSLNRKG